MRYSSSKNIQIVYVRQQPAAVCVYQPKGLKKDQILVNWLCSQKFDVIRKIEIESIP